MLIYTGNCYGKDLDLVKQYQLGIMIASTTSKFMPVKEYRDIPCILDNGAFQYWMAGREFQDTPFLRTLDRCHELNIPLNFVTCPDIVAGGLRSLDFSLSWADKLKDEKLALVVQDGISPEHIESYKLPSNVTTIFVGGTKRWKWQTARYWLWWSYTNTYKLHIGRCGELKYLEYAEEIGADSVDSTSFVRRKKWHLLDQYRNRTGTFWK